MPHARWLRMRSLIAFAAEALAVLLRCALQRPICHNLSHSRPLQTDA